MKTWAFILVAMVFMATQTFAQSAPEGPGPNEDGALVQGDNQTLDPDQDRQQDQDGTMQQDGEGPGGPGDGEPGYGRPEDPQRPQFPEELIHQLQQIRQSRQQLLAQLKAVLQNNQDATQEERKAAVDAWKEANGALIDQQRELAKNVKEQIREMVRNYQPENEAPEEPEPPVDENGNLNMEQVRERNQARRQVQEEFMEKMKNAVNAEERQQLVQEYKIQRRQQIQEERMEILAREGTLNREGSIEALRELLKSNTEAIRAEARLRERGEKASELKAENRQTIRERVVSDNRGQQIADERANRPDRPVKPERPEKPEREDPATRREQLEERLNR